MGDIMAPLKNIERMENALLDAAAFYAHIVVEMEQRQKAICLGDGERHILIHAKYMRRKLMADYTMVRTVSNW